MGTQKHPKHMFKLMDKKIIAILGKLFFLNWPYGARRYFLSDYISLFLSYRSINRNDLQTYIKEHYKGPRIVLAAAGGRTKIKIVYSLLHTTSPPKIITSEKRFFMNFHVKWLQNEKGLSPEKKEFKCNDWLYFNYGGRA